MRKRIMKDAAGGRKTKGGNELEDLNVERVDAVDAPATGSAFLILKAADETELRGNTKALVVQARKTLKAVASGELDLPDEVVESLQALADMVELDKGMFGKKPGKGMKAKDSEEADSKSSKVKAKDGDDEDEEDEDEDEEETVTPSKKAKTKDDSDEDRLVAKIAEANATALAPLFASFAKAVTGQDFKVMKAKSRQPEADDEPAETKRPVAKEMGKGLFANVVWGS